MIRVINQREQPTAGAIRINIMRPTVLGNPFHINARTTRKEAIEQYTQWVTRNTSAAADAARAAIRNIIELDRKGAYIELACCCKPQACHGDIIMKLVIAARSEAA